MAPRKGKLHYNNLTTTNNHIPPEFRSLTSFCYEGDVHMPDPSVE
jgi:hypothetical protein